MSNTKSFVGFTVTPELKKAMQECAAKEQRTLSGWLRRVLQKVLAR